MGARISVVIPTFNAARFLAECISSVRSQTRPVDEIIVVDDGSTDGSPDVAEALGARVLRSERNAGSAVARNRGLRAARGEYVAMLDADDHWEPHHCELVAGLLDAHPEAVLAFGRVRSFGLSSDEWPALLPEGEPTWALSTCLERTVLPHNAVVLRRDAVLALGGYDERYRLAQDYDLWLRLSHRHPFVCTHAITANWRRHDGQNSRNMIGYWTGEYESRARFLTALRAEGSTLVDKVAASMFGVWEDHLQSAWHDRRADHFALHLEMASFVPGAERTRARWRRRGGLIPVARFWDALPTGIKSSVRRIRRALRPRPEYQAVAAWLLGSSLT